MFIHGCEYGVFKVIPTRSKGSCVGICVKVVHAEVDILRLLGLRSASTRIMSWPLSLGITLVLFMSRTLFVRNRFRMCKAMRGSQMPSGSFVFVLE